MQSSIEGELIVAKLDDGDDLLRRIDELAARWDVKHGLVMWAIGMLRDFEVGYFNGKEYERETYAEPMELLALHGTFAGESDPRAHLHVAAAGRDHRVVGGHLFRASVAVLNELCMRRLSHVELGRTLNPKSGLKELTVKDPGRLIE